MPVALYAGSFDPVHLGHLGVIERAAGSHDRVVVGVLANPDKPRGMFPPDVRVRLLEAATRHLGNVSTVRFHGLTVDLARHVGATVLVRVAHKERDVELTMAAMNLSLTGIPTTLIPPGAETRSISSSVIRDLVLAGHLEAAQHLVPPCVRPALAAAGAVSAR